MQNAKGRLEECKRRWEQCKRRWAMGIHASRFTFQASSIKHQTSLYTTQKRRQTANGIATLFAVCRLRLPEDHYLLDIIIEIAFAPRTFDLEDMRGHLGGIKLDIDPLAAP